MNEKSIYQIANEMIVKLGENPDGQKNKLKELKKELTTVKSQISELLRLKSLKLVSDDYLVCKRLSNIQRESPEGILRSVERNHLCPCAQFL